MNIDQLGGNDLLVKAIVNIRCFRHLASSMPRILGSCRTVYL